MVLPSPVHPRCNHHCHRCSSTIWSSISRPLLLSSSASVFNPHITTILIPLNAECDALHLPSTLTAVPGPVYLCVSIISILVSFLLHSRATIALFCTFGPPDRRLLLSSSASVFNPHITTILIPLNAECDALHLPSTLTAVPGPVYLCVSIIRNYLKKGLINRNVGLLLLCQGSHFAIFVGCE
ncbi:uncharacterized protein ACNLHF_026135 [Anomaloglossus baeobatrachus]